MQSLTAGLVEAKWGRWSRWGSGGKRGRWGRRAGGLGGVRGVGGVRRKKEKVTSKKKGYISEKQSYNQACYQPNDPF